MPGEQTWPTEEELSAAAAASRRMRKRRLPAGTSEYQAAWILDSDEDSSEGSEDGSEGGLY
jgi:pre-rRNA-processing protein TSR1